MGDASTAPVAKRRGPPSGPLALALLLLSSCVGTIGSLDSPPHGAGGRRRPAGAGGAGTAGIAGVGGGGGSPLPVLGGAPSTPIPVQPFTCDTAAKPPVDSLRRLTMTQYQNTIADLVAWAVGDAATGRTIMNEIAGALAELPEDRREPVPQDLHGSYRRLDQTLQQVHVDATYDVAVAAGAALTTAARIGKVVGTCATDSSTSNDASCLDSFIKKFGARVLRRPLTSDEVTFYTSAYGSSASADPAAYADLIGIFLTAPELLYFAEHGDAAVSGQPGVYAVSAYELASRLSYQLWQTSPDDELLAAAADGSLLTAATYQREVTRLLGDARARPALDEFFADWTKVDDLPALDAKAQDPTFKTFAGSDLPGAGLRQAMIDDVIGFLDYHTWTQPSGIAALFSSELSFATDARLAAIYGVKAWDGVSAPPALPAGQRPGLLTRALFLSTGTANTRPIMKGVFIRKNVLCDDIPPPPPGANAKPPDLGPNMTTRESVAAITEMPGTICAGCHQTLINPLGYATESFDALGRFRTAQRLFDDTGKQTGTKAIDTTAVPQVLLGDSTLAAGAADLMSLISGSGKVEACLSRNFFRFTYGRWEDTAQASADGCALEDASQVLAGGGTITDLLKAAVMAAEFKRRTFQ